MKTNSRIAQESSHRKELDLTNLTSTQIANFCGSLNQNLKAIESHYHADLVLSNNHLSIISPEIISGAVIRVIETILEASLISNLSVVEVERILCLSEKQNVRDSELYSVKLKKKFIKPKTSLQCRYLQSIDQKIVNFGIGPAGTGKTYLAVAKAVQALENEDVSRLILTRPAVEGGEKLGFLPGDLSQKVDPYLRPVYDALYEMVGFDKVEKLISRHVIEVAPLAYMRGRTLNNAFVLLDEAQNTTPAQMKMFLTRIGFGSRAVITGDVTQTDLPNRSDSGLQHSLDILKGIDAIGFINFTSEDVVRHPLVQNIVEAYDRHEANDKP